MVPKENMSEQEVIARFLDELLTVRRDDDVVRLKKMLDKDCTVIISGTMVPLIAIQPTTK